MKKQLSILALLLAGCLLTLHNLTPHFHHETAAGKPKTEGVLDWLGDLFSIDLGEGHLEYFSVSKNDLGEQTQLDFAQPVFFENAQFCLFSIEKTEKQHLSFPLPPLIFSKAEHTACGLRAPPFSA